MINLEEILKQNEAAIRVRENGDLVKSRRMFGEMLPEVNLLKDSKDLSDLDVYFRVMGEWVIQLRHEGKSLLQKALKIAREMYEITKQKQRENPRVIRGVSNTLMNLEAYELAESYLKKMLKIIPQSDSARIGDAQAHLARCLFRTSKIKESKALIDEALVAIGRNTDNALLLEIAAWKSHALMVKSLVQNSEGKKKLAIIAVKEALALAKKENIIPRVHEAEELIEFLLSKK